MSAQSGSNRWVPFQCPSCFGVFRLKKPQIGSVGHCPTCGELVHVSLNAPALGEVQLEVAAEEKVSAAPRGVENEDLLEKVAVAQQMTPEEIAAQEEVYKNQKRQYSAGGTDMVDWERELGKEEANSFSWLTIWGVGMLFVLSLIGAAYYFKTRESGVSEGSQTVVIDDASQAKLGGLLGEGVKNEEEGIIEVNMRKAEGFDFAESERVVKAFLNSVTVTERLAYVREPERVRPLMLRYYGGEQIEAEGYHSLDKTQVDYQKGFFATTVQTSEFLDFTILMIDLGEGGDVRYFVDWESWVGYSDMKPEELREKKPTEAQLMRVLVSKENYYNYHFSDDRKWSSFRLEIRDSEFTFLGYLERESEMERELLKRLKRVQTEPFVIKVAYPPNSKSMDQVEIMEIISPGWILNIDEEKDHE